MTERLFASGKFLAIVGDDQEYWLCKCRQHVYEGKTENFWVQWLEKEADLYKYPIKTTHFKRTTSDEVAVKSHISINLMHNLLIVFISIASI